MFYTTRNRTDANNNHNSMLFRLFWRLNNTIYKVDTESTCVFPQKWRWRMGGQKVSNDGLWNKSTIPFSILQCRYWIKLFFSRNEDDEWAANKSVAMSSEINPQYHSLSYAVDDQLFYTTWTEECASTQNDHLFVKHLWRQLCHAV